MFQLCKRCTSFWIPIPSGWEGQILWHMVLLVPFSTCLCRQRRAPSTVTQSLTGVMSLSYFAGGIFEPRPRALLGWWLKPSAKWLRCAWPRVSGTKCSCGAVQGSCTVPLERERRDEVINEVIDQTCNMPKLLITSHHSGWAFGVLRADLFDASKIRIKSNSHSTSYVLICSDVPVTSVSRVSRSFSVCLIFRGKSQAMLELSPMVMLWAA